MLSCASFLLYKSLAPKRILTETNNNNNNNNNNDDDTTIYKAP